MTEPSDGRLETAEDILEREISELEQPFARSWYTWGASLLAAGVLGGLVTLLFIMPGERTRAPAGSKGEEVVLLEPRDGTLSETPRGFRWATVPRATAYIVSVSRADNGEVIMLRSTTDPQLTTLDTEVSRFDTGRYVWAVEAHGSGGVVLARGEGGFRLTRGTEG
jgi:hypothetical protein